MQVDAGRDCKKRARADTPAIVLSSEGAGLGAACAEVAIRPRETCAWKRAEGRPRGLADGEAERNTGAACSLSQTHTYAHGLGRQRMVGPSAGSASAGIALVCRCRQPRCPGAAPPLPDALCQQGTRPGQAGARAKLLRSEGLTTNHGSDLQWAAGVGCETWDLCAGSADGGMMWTISTSTSA